MNQLISPVSVCRICGSKNIIPDRVFPGSQFFVHRFVLCQDCSSLLYVSGGALDYQSGTVPYNLEPFLRYDLYCEYGLLFFTHLLSLANSCFANGSHIKMLDIGGGFGVMAHMAKLLYGWDVVSADPSYRSHEGAKALAINGVGLVDESAFGAEKFNVIICSEVIEHVERPDELAATIRSLLSPDGVAIFTTPNAESVSLRHRPKAWADDINIAYGPGQHFNIFSKNSLSMILKRNDLFCREIYLSEGLSGDNRLIAVCERTQEFLNKQPQFASQELRFQIFKRYVKYALAEPVRSGLHRIYLTGLKYRLFELLINEGDFSGALPLDADLADHLCEKKSTLDDCLRLNAKNAATFLEDFVPFAGKYFYYKGLLLLHQEKHLEAARYFKGAHETVRKIKPFISGSYWEDMIGLAMLHEAMAQGHAGHYDKSLDILECAGQLDWDYLPDNIRTRIEAERRKAESLRFKSVS